jgi:hypothetical protein
LVILSTQTLGHIKPFKIVNVQRYKYELEEQLHWTTNAWETKQQKAKKINNNNKKKIR